MIRALSETPNEFEMEGDLVHHRPSRHILRFNVCGNAQLVARCNCAELPVSQKQSDELRAAVAVWQVTYWRPLLARGAAERRVAEINRAFAEHFRPRSRLRRAFGAVLSFLGTNNRHTFDHVDPALPEDSELQARSAPAAREAKKEEWLSV